MVVLACCPVDPPRGDVFVHQRGRDLSVLRVGPTYQMSAEGVAFAAWEGYFIVFIVFIAIGSLPL